MTDSKKTAAYCSTERNSRDQEKTEKLMSSVFNKSIQISTATTFKKTMLQFKSTFNKERKDTNILLQESNGFVLKKVNSAIDVKPNLLLKNNIKTIIKDGNPLESKDNVNIHFLNDVKKDLIDSCLRKTVSYKNIRRNKPVLGDELYIAEQNEDIYQYFHNPNFIDELKRRDPFFADKLIKLKRYSFRFNQITEKMTKNYNKYNKRLDLELIENLRKSQETRNLFKSANNPIIDKHLKYQAIKRAGKKPKMLEQKMLKFRIPGKEHILEEEDSLDKLLSPKLKKLIKFKFHKDNENEFKIYQTKRIKSLSNHKVLFNDCKPALYKEMMKTCNIANEESEFTLNKLICTRKRNYEQEKDENLCKIDEILKKNFYIK